MSTAKEKAATVAHLVEQGKTFFDTERRYLSLVAADRLSHLTSWLITAFVVIGVGMLLFTLLMLTLVHFLAITLDSVAWAYALVTAFVLVVILMIWSCRTWLIVRPVRNLFKQTLLDEVTAALSQSASKALQDKLTVDLEKQRDAMEKSYHKITEVDTTEPTFGERIGRYIDTGLTAYRGVSFSMGLVNMLRGKHSKTKTKKTSTK